MRRDLSLLLVVAASVWCCCSSLSSGQGVCAPLPFPPPSWDVLLECTDTASNHTSYEMHHGELDRFFFGTPNTTYEQERERIFDKARADPSRAAILPPGLLPNTIGGPNFGNQDVFFLCPGKQYYSIAALFAISYLGPIYPDTLPEVFSSSDIQSVCGITTVTDKSPAFWPAVSGRILYASRGGTWGTVGIPLASLIDHVIFVEYALRGDSPDVTGPTFFWYSEVQFLDVHFLLNEFLHERFEDCSFDGTVAGRLVFRAEASLKITRSVMRHRNESGIDWFHQVTGRWVNATEERVSPREHSQHVVFQDLVFGMVWMENVTLENVSGGLLYLLSSTPPGGVLDLEDRATGFLWNGNNEFHNITFLHASSALVLLETEAVSCPLSFSMRNISLHAGALPRVAPLLTRFLFARRPSVALSGLTVHVNSTAQFLALTVDVSAANAVGRYGDLRISNMQAVSSTSQPELIALAVFPYPVWNTACLHDLPPARQALLLSLEFTDELFSLDGENLFGGYASPLNQTEKMQQWDSERIPFVFTLSRTPLIGSPVPWFHLDSVPRVFPRSAFTLDIREVDVPPEQVLLLEEPSASSLNRTSLLDLNLTSAEALYWSEGYDTDWEAVMQPLLCLKTVHLSPWWPLFSAGLPEAGDPFLAPYPWNETLCDFLSANITRLPTEPPNNITLPCNATGTCANVTLPCNVTGTCANTTTVNNSTQQDPCVQRFVSLAIGMQQVGMGERWTRSLHFPSVFKGTEYKIRLNCSLLGVLEQSATIKTANDSLSSWITHSCPALEWNTGAAWWNAPLSPLQWNSTVGGGSCDQVEISLHVTRPQGMALLEAQQGWDHLNTTLQPQTPWYQGPRELCLACTHRDTTLVMLSFEYVGTDLPYHTVPLPSWTSPCRDPPDLSCTSISLSSDLRPLPWSKRDTPNYRIRATFVPPYLHLPDLRTPPFRVVSPPPTPPSKPENQTGGGSNNGGGGDDQDPGKGNPGSPSKDNSTSPSPPPPSSSPESKGASGSSWFVPVVICAGLTLLAVVFIVWWCRRRRRGCCTPQELTGEEKGEERPDPLFCSLERVRFLHEGQDPVQERRESPVWPMIPGPVKQRLEEIRKNRLDQGRGELEPFHKLFYRRTEMGNLPR